MLIGIFRILLSMVPKEHAIISEAYTISPIALEEHTKIAVLCRKFFPMKKTKKPCRPGRWKEGDHQG
jgi:hypothetical protein